MFDNTSPRESGTLSTTPRISADRETALKLFEACVAAEFQCVARISDYVYANHPNARGLLEDMLSMQGRHAQDLLQLIHAHRIAC